MACCPAWLQDSPSLPHVETEGRSGRIHGTRGNGENAKAQDMPSSRMGRAPATLGTWGWEGTSFSTPRNYGSNIHHCRLLICTAQEKTHLLQHRQPPLAARSSPTPGELHLVGKGGCKIGITGFLLNPAGTNTQRTAGSYCPVLPSSLSPSLLD